MPPSKSSAPAPQAVDFRRATPPESPRRRQILGVQFNRQKVIAGYIVDFYAFRAGLVIEIDGGQHWDPEHLERDSVRDRSLRRLGLRVLRFSNAEVLVHLKAVVCRIWRPVEEAGEHPP